MDVYRNARAGLTPGNNPIPIVQWLDGSHSRSGEEKILIPTSFRIMNRPPRSESCVLGLTNLWHTYPKWHAQRFLWHTAFTAVPFFMYFVRPASLYYEEYLTA
jgi:hypothetical protein